MPAERYYYPQSLENNTPIYLEGQEHHHLVNVMRTRLGEEVEVVNGQGQLAATTVESLEKKRAVLSVQTVFTANPPTIKIILAQGLPRFARLELIMEKCTELGMTEIWLFPAARSEKKDLSESQFTRLETIAVASMKQCGRLFLPKIVVMPPLKRWTETPVKTCYFGDLREGAPKVHNAWPAGSQEALFFVGPESGFTEDEVKQMESLHATGVKLHSNVLRTETAAIAALSLVSHLMPY
ncbi:MAG: RsmE family RNA methyltransferase [Parachlamydiaceae bacterium]